jgi:hypothetical protein
MWEGEVARTFESSLAVPGDMPLIIGMTGPSNSGKTYSALRLGTGAQRVTGGDIFGIDTEAGRMRHYADRFKFQHVPFKAPYSPLDYMAAFDYCIKKGAKVIIADSMTHEHEGEGGLLDQSEKYLDAKAGDDYRKREALNQLSYKKPKSERKVLNNFIIQHGEVIFILCYRAQEKSKLVKVKQDNGGMKNEMVKLGWQPTTTSPLPFEMTARFLLEPGCEGKPTTAPTEMAETMLIKNPIQFKSIIKPGQQLDESMGEYMAQWAKDGGIKKAPLPTAPLATVLTDCKTLDALQVTFKSLPPDIQRQLEGVKNDMKSKLTQAAADTADIL